MRKHKKTEENNVSPVTSTTVTPTSPIMAGQPYVSQMIPLVNGKIRGIQLPPIIQPIAVVPFNEAPTISHEDDDFEDFDIFDEDDDWPN